jgi:hypothetical protein
MLGSDVGLVRSKVSLWVRPNMDSDQGWFGKHRPQNTQDLTEESAYASWAVQSKVKQSGDINMKSTAYELTDRAAECAWQELRPALRNNEYSNSEFYSVGSDKLSIAIIDY